MLTVLLVLGLISKYMQTIRYALVSRKEGNVLFNDTLNTLYLQLYHVKHMVKDSERGNPLP